jgi:hypothetical protein
MPDKKSLIGNYCQVARKDTILLSSGVNYECIPWDLGLSSRDLLGLVIHRLEIQYCWGDAVADQACAMGFVLSGRDIDGTPFGILAEQQPSAYVVHQRLRAQLTSGSVTEDVAVMDFSSLPGGGLLIPARPLYIATRAVGLGSQEELVVTMYYELMDLDQATLLDLVQTMLGYGSTP